MELAAFQQARWRQPCAFAIPRPSPLGGVVLLVAGALLLVAGLSGLVPGDELQEGLEALALGPLFLGAVFLWRWRRSAAIGFVEFRPDGLAYGRRREDAQVLGWEQIYFVRLHQQDQQVQQIEIRLHDRSSRILQLGDPAAMRRLARLIDPGPESLAWIGGQVAAGRSVEDAAQAAGLPRADTFG